MKEQFLFLIPITVCVVVGMALLIAADNNARNTVSQPPNSGGVTVDSSGPNDGHIEFGKSEGLTISFALFSIDLDGSMTISTEKGDIEIDGKTGRVTIPKDLPLDKASLAFWKAVADMKSKMNGEPSK